MTLRPYQKESHDAIMSWVRHSRAPCCIEAATGSGKSHIIAAVAAMVLEVIFQAVHPWLMREPHRPKLVVLL